MYKNEMTFEENNIDHFDDELDNFPLDEYLGNADYADVTQIRKVKATLPSLGGFTTTQQRLKQLAQGAAAVNQIVSSPTVKPTDKITALNLNPMSTGSNESMLTSPGQIGLAAIPTFQDSTKAQLSGGGGGDMDSGITPMSPDTGYSTDEPTGTLADTKTLDNVTVTAQKAGTKTLLLALGIVAVIIAIVYFTKGTTK